jgi:hypothetical protein
MKRRARIQPVNSVTLYTKLIKTFLFLSAVWFRQTWLKYILHSPLIKAESFRRQFSQDSYILTSITSKITYSKFEPNQPIHVKSTDINSLTPLSKVWPPKHLRLINSNRSKCYCLHLLYHILSKLDGTCAKKFY